MNIKDRLNSWAEQYAGSAEIHSTITLKNKDINVVVSGDTLEEAYEKLRAICISSDNKEIVSKETTSTNVPEPKKLNLNEVPKPQVNMVQQVPQNNTSDLQSILNGRQLLRMYDPTKPLNPDEEIQRIGNLDYVVKVVK